MLAFGTLTAELAQHRPTQNFITSHQRLLTFVVVPIILLIGGFVGSYPQEHEDWAPWSRFLHSVLTSGGEGGSLITPNGSDIQRRTSAFFIMCTAASLFLSPTFQKLLSHRLLIWLGHHSFAVYLVHGTILRTVGMWIVFGIRGEPWVPPALNEDGSPMEPDWLQPKGDLHKAVGIIVFTTLTYTAAWAWMKWVDTSCARATQWLENRVFEDEDAEGKDGIAEKGFGLANGNGVPPPRPHHEREQPPP
jgi:hypothetical protein